MSKYKHRSKRKKRFIRNTISAILEVVLTMIIAILLCSVSLRFGFFDNDLILSKINESNYYNNVYSELMENINTILDSKDLPADLVKECISDKRVYINGKQYIDNSLEGKDTVVAVDKINEELNVILTDYYESIGMQIDETVQSNINSVINDIDSEYMRMIRFQFVDYIKKYKAAYREAMTFSLPLVAIMSIMIIVVLLKLHRYPHRGVRFTAIALLSASAINMLLPLYCIVNKVYDGLNILPNYYCDFLETYIKWSCYAFVYTGAFGIVVAFILFGVMRVLKHNIK